MFDINNDSKLRAAYIFAITMDASPKGSKGALDALMVEVKHEIRAYTHRPEADARIVQERGCDGYIELVQLPDSLDRVHKEIADDWFRATRYLECFPTPYDCSGQKFTSWYKLFRRRGHWFAYHCVSIDV